MPDTGTRFAVLLFTDIVGSTELKVRHGVPAFSAALRAHNAHFERVASQWLNLRTLQNRGDGYFAEAGSVAEAVQFALSFQDAMRSASWGEIPLVARLGIHAGEIGSFEASDGTWVVGPAADLAARVTSLAVGGQILLTRIPFDEGRHFIREHPPIPGGEPPPLRWLAHGPYLIKGSDEPLEIFEVGAEGLAPLAAPPDGEKARRAIRPGEEETLGWRPAIGLEIPGRTGWHLTGKLGSGGFGEVWVGEHAKLHQQRAFKFCFDDERLRALKREVTLTRLLRTTLGERDDIVRIHELKLDSPPFYLESDLAPHGNMVQWAERQGGLDRIPLIQRISLVAHTATALAAAHSIGVLHKDIKPTNILIFDGPNGEARPRLVDFGIGTLADPGVLAKHGVTAAGFTRASILHSTGTPTYSPPEYLAGRPYTIQGDIYGLGVLLYQLVTAKLHDPLAPGWERDVADPLLREDIFACVDGDPARRLPSAADLAERLLTLDARRAAIREKERAASERAALAAAEASAFAARERARRFRRLATAFALLALAALASGFLARRNQRKADEARIEVGRKNSEYRGMLIESARSDRIIAEEKLRSGQEREGFAYLARAIGYDPASALAAEKAVAELNTWQQRLPDLVLIGHTEAVSSAEFSRDGKRIVTASTDGTARVWDASTGENLSVLSGHKAAVWSAGFSPDGKRVVTASLDATARVWDAENGALLGTLDGHEGGVAAAQFNMDGRLIVTASRDQTARIWDAGTFSQITKLEGHEGGLGTTQFSRDGERVVTVLNDRTAQVFEAANGRSIAPLEGHAGGVNSAQFSPDGTRVVTSSWDQTAHVWDAATGEDLLSLADHQSGVNAAQFSTLGTRIVTGSADMTARVWDAGKGTTLVTLIGHDDAVISAQFCSDDTRIVTVSRDGTARVWDADAGRSLAIFSDVTAAQFSPDGRRIVTASRDGSARVWDAMPAKGQITLEGTDTAEFSADGSRVVTTSRDSIAQVWDTTTGRMLIAISRQKPVPPGENIPEGTPSETDEEPDSLFEVKSAHFSPDGRRIVTVSGEKVACVWDAATGLRVATLEGHRDQVNDARFSSSSARIVTVSDDKTARVWDAATGSCLAVIEGHEYPFNCAEFDGDGTRVVTASDDGTARVWNAATAQAVAETERTELPVHIAQFSPDGRRIFTLADEKVVRVWDAGTGGLIKVLKGHLSDVQSAEFSPDSARIVTSSEDETARVWSIEEGSDLLLAGHRDAMNDARFSPDGTRIVTASDDGTARIWDVARRKSIATLDGHKVAIRSAQFSADGARILTVSMDGTSRIWTLLPPGISQPPEWFPGFLQYISRMCLNADGEVESIKPEAWLELREQMRKVLRSSTSREDPYLEVLRRFAP